MVQRLVSPSWPLDLSSGSHGKTRSTTQWENAFAVIWIDSKILLASSLDRRRWSVGFLVALGTLVLAGTTSALDIVPRSFSRTRQFVVYAHDGALRAAIGTLGEDTKEEMLRALALSDQWKVPIVVDLRAPLAAMQDAAPPVRLSLAQTGASLKIELDLLIGEAGRGTRIRDELVRTLLLEMAYRDHQNLPSGRGYTPPPPWLVEGFSAYVDNVEDGASARTFAALLPTTQTLPISEFLARDPSGMDSTSRAVYRAYAYNLVSLLLRDLEGGRAGLAAFIHDLPTLPPEESRSAGVLAQHFPQLAGTPDGLEKWWTLGLARLAAAEQFRALSVEETEERLQPLLSIRTLPDPKKPAQPVKTYSLNDFSEFTGHKQSARLLETTRRGLMELSGKANPLCRPIILGYQKAVSELARDHTKGVRQLLDDLAEARKRVLKEREQIADYVNWFEATQVPVQSGAFENYLRASGRSSRLRPAHRPDAISTYMDSMEAEYH